MPPENGENSNREASIVQLVTSSADPEKALEKQMKAREKQTAYSINKFLDNDEEPQFKDVSRASVKGQER